MPAAIVVAVLAGTTQVVPAGYLSPVTSPITLSITHILTAPGT